MALYCSEKLFEVLDGVMFPATKQDLIEYSALSDAPEAVTVALDTLDDGRIYGNISEVCENARIACHYDTIKLLSKAEFPAKRNELLTLADIEKAPPSVKHALESLPSEYTFDSMDEICEYIL